MTPVTVTFSVFKLAFTVFRTRYGRGYDTSNVLSLSLAEVAVRLVISIFVPLCGCGTWSLTLTEHHTQRVYEKRVLREIFRSQEEETAA